MKHNGGVILLVEDNPDDVELTLRAFEKHKLANEIVVMRDGEAALHFLFGTGEHAGRDASVAPQVVLLDLKLPKVDGLEVLRRMRSDKRTQLVPVVILTSSTEDRDVLGAYTLGANSYIRKPVDFSEFVSVAGQLGLYWLVLNKILSRGTTDVNTRLRALIVEDSEDDAEMLVRALRQGGYDVVHERVDTAGRMEASLHRDAWDIVLADYALPTFSGPAALALLKGSGRDLPFIVVSGTIGEEAAVEALKSGADDFLVKGRWARLVPAVERSLRSATERRERVRAEDALRQSEAKHRSLFEGAVFGIYQATVDGRFLTVNPALASMLGCDPPSDSVGTSASDLLVDGPSLADLQVRLGSQSRFTGEEAIWRRKTGQSIRVRLSGRVIDQPGSGLPVFEVIVEDVTERHHLEEQLRQAQKMEAIGRLAGGIAHDFNNLLTAILGYCRLLLDQVQQEDLVADIEEIRKAGERASSLTGQLLAFSRKQVIEPRTLDLNALVSNVEKMLRRVIGEDIRLDTSLADPLGRVKADPGQLEQVLVNLAVNARDAMPRGGLLRLQTSNTSLPPELLGPGGDGRADAYVSLTVADTGCGMPPEVRARMFEPFFTTKEPGRGTGLGLSTVYGIVAQNRGHIAVESEPNRGTAFTVYLPVATDAIETVGPTLRDSGSVAGTETILLVDDEPSVRELARRVLQGHGYEVLDAGDAATALMITRQHPGPIHLLISDIVMPGMNGRDLAQWVVSSRPRVQVLYISGYPDPVADGGSTHPQTACLTKPFSPEQLARKVREQLNLSPQERDQHQ